MRIVAVTSCPTGIAHTYMAAEALEEAARAAGDTIEVETQGAAGMNKLAAEAIASADVVILAADVEVRERERFSGKPTVEVAVSTAINSAPAVLEEARARVASFTPASASAPKSATPPATPLAAAGFGSRLRQWLMTGVSYMIPFVAAGGILIAVSFIISGPQVAMQVNGGIFHGVHYAGATSIMAIYHTAGIGGVLFEVGGVAFSMLVPILAGFIAYGMADRQGLVPGIIGGLIAVDVHAGFLGGIIAGLLAGATVRLILKVPVPRVISGMMPIVVVPLISATVVGVLMLVVIGNPVSFIMTEITNWLNSLSGANAIGLGALLGLMMAFDMGGPVNKVAYTFAVAGLASGGIGGQKVMAAVMAAGMVPPLALALATVLRRRLFNDAERKAGEAAWLLGASFITEGAIPFAAADPLRVIPSIMAGSAVTGALSMAFAVSSPAPHGGIWVVGLLGHWPLWILSIAAGTVVGSACVIALKSLRRTVPSSASVISIQEVANA